MEFNLTINSIQDPKLLHFQVQLIDWNNLEMRILLNFTNPSLVSNGLNFDIINIRVLNGSYFKS